MRYTEAFNDNNEYFAKIQPLLGRGETIDPDIIAPTGWMAGRLIDARAGSRSCRSTRSPTPPTSATDLQEPTWDPEGKYTLPWQTGITGIAYNVRRHGPASSTSVNDLFDPGVQGQGRDADGDARHDRADPAVARHRHPSTTRRSSRRRRPSTSSSKAKDDGQIRRFTGNDYFDDLSNGNFAVYDRLVRRRRPARP